MVFSSLIFVCLFLPAAIAAYFIVPARLRNRVLVVASLIYYAWGVPLAVVLVVSLIAINFRLGQLIDDHAGRRRKQLVAAAVALNLGVLIFFKYSDFILQNVNVLLSPVTTRRAPLLHIALPLGISFFTFHIISYLVDVYRGTVSAQRSPSAFTLYIINFPQLIAGPIIRYHLIEDQLEKRIVKFDDVDAGIGRFAIGLAKKLLIANPIGAIADQIFSVTPNNLSSATAWLGMICYGLQIYFDFSGYTDMAIGIARVFGFHFPENFNYPYAAQSIQDFWRRWHMTLSFWFRDYVYIPLGGNRRGAWMTARNLWIVFLLTGTWHGASWNFVVWGMWHGLFLFIERLRPVAAALARSPQVLRHLYTLFVVFIGWVFFRSPDLSSAIGYLTRVFGFGGWREGLPMTVIVSTPMAFLIVLAALLSLPVWPQVRAAGGRLSVSNSGAIVVDLARAALVAGIMFLSLSTMAVEQYNPFIYFQF